jgi:hypothetical protein
MVYEKTEGRWRAWLTDDETKRIAEIDAPHADRASDDR